MSSDSSSGSNHLSISPNAFSSLVGRARAQAFSLGSEDGDSIHVTERREDYMVTSSDNYFCDERHITNGNPSISFAAPQPSNPPVPSSSSSSSSAAAAAAKHPSNLTTSSSTTSLAGAPTASTSSSSNQKPTSSTAAAPPSVPGTQRLPSQQASNLSGGNPGSDSGGGLSDSFDQGGPEVSGLNYANPYSLDDWRMRERLKTVSAALILCLNIGVDPPDVVKTSPCAKLECWIDPFSQPPAKVLENIGKNLQAQYEKWQPKARYKVLPDPTVEEVKKTCLSLRKNAKDERILFHYNGHGVPKPTPNGEIWVFNKNFTQYIPISVYDLQTWIGSPSIFVYDCSAAGNIINAFNQFAEQREREYDRMHLSNTSSSQLVQPMRDCIQLAACRKDQVLPTNPDLPADLFSSCLTTPIDIALRWFIMQNSLLSKISIDIIDKIPGRLNDRRTPLGELNWIFTAITDTIAWTMLPRSLFQKLFRQDLLVASIFRNFLLAERVMRTYNCTPISYPPLPQTHQHSLWQAWDLAVDSFLMQFLGEIRDVENFDHSPFFNEQLTAFEVWLDLASVGKSPPAQLPIVLQVLLSQNHRLRALQLLGRFLDIGPWAVNLALSVGLFPYVLKLLQSPATELRKLLVHIWAKIVCVDRSCQADLIKDNGFKYFIMVIWNPSVRPDERALAACVLSVVCTGFRTGQQACLKGGAIAHCLTHLNNSDPTQRLWLCLLLAEIWASYGDAKMVALRDGANEKLQALLSDPVPEVRAAAVYALGKLLGDLEKTDEVTQIENAIIISLVLVTADSSPLVRKELVNALSIAVSLNEPEFRATAAELWDEEQKKTNTLEKRASTASLSKSPIRDRSSMLVAQSPFSVYQCVWKVLLNLSVDPFPEVSFVAQNVVDAINIHVVNIQQPLGPQQATPKAPANPPGHRKTASLKNLLTLSSSSSENINSPTTRVASPSPMKRTNSGPRPLSKLPLESTLYDWCIECFNKSGSEKSQAENPRYLEQIWKSRRNEAVIRTFKTSQKHAGQKRFDDQIAFFANEREGDIISLVKFHPFEPILVVADQQDYVSVWDINEAKRLCKIFNHNPPGTRLTSLEIINPKDQSLLMIGSDEGVVRLWKDYETKSNLTMVTSWRALTDLLPSPRGSGLITEWQQEHGTLFVSGDVRVIRAWDAVKELCVQDIPTSSDSCITTLTSNRVQGHLVIAGCGDGTIRIYDRRQPSRDSLVMALNEHKGWVVNCQYQQSSGELISGSVAGDVRIWDLRAGHSVKVIDSQGTMSALAVHEHAPLFACGSNNQYIKILNTEGETLNMIRYHDGFLGQRIGPISSLSFHPYKLLLATGSTDSIVSVFA